MSKEIAIRPRVGPQLPLSFRLLGPFQVMVRGEPVWPGPEQVQRLIVKLLVAKGEPVGNHELMRAIWGEVAGPGATSEALHKLASAARRRLAAFGLHDVLINERGRYRLDVPPALVDVHEFHVLTAQAHGLASDGDQRAVAVLERALKLQSGVPLTGLRGDWVDGYRETLTGELHAAEQDLYENAIKHDEAHGRLPGLAALQRDHPDDERVTWLYMHALYRAGQQAKALAVKQELDRHLRDEYGMDCGRALNDLYQRILNKDDALLTPEAVAFPAGEIGARTRRPGHRDPRAAQENQQEQQERTAYQGEKHAGPAGAAIPTVSHEFYGRVDATHAVFGPQINYGAPR